MRIDCEETTDWEKWFAWRPVFLSHRWIVLWETVERRRYTGKYIYRFPTE